MGEGTIEEFIQGRIIVDFYGLKKTLAYPAAFKIGALYTEDVFLAEKVNADIEAEEELERQEREAREKSRAEREPREREEKSKNKKRLLFGKTLLLNVIFVMEALMTNRLDFAAFAVMIT